GLDVARYFNDILEDLGKQENIDLFLYSRGGEINGIYPLVQLIRRHCKNFNVLIHYRAHSTATLLSLGADNIVMGEMGQLSPIDPTTMSLFNPADPTNPAGRWPISVEDVTAYLSLAAEKADLVTEEFSRCRIIGSTSTAIMPFSGYMLTRPRRDVTLGLKAVRSWPTCKCLPHIQSTG
ncbi:MAG: hypothetical protein WAM14_22480, partial [Candidatus Nitrosopolaris sp.]